MSYIEEKIIIKAPLQIIWKTWSDNFLEKGYEMGKKNKAMEKRGVKFKIEDFKENESLTLAWYSYMLKLVFFHKVETVKEGSLVTCQVKVKGFFSFIIKPIIKNKIKNQIKESLNTFARNLNGL